MQCLLNFYFHLDGLYVVTTSQSVNAVVAIFEHVYSEKRNEKKSQPETISNLDLVYHSYLSFMLSNVYVHIFLYRIPDIFFSECLFAAHFFFIRLNAL